MKDIRDELIAKLEELVNHLRKWLRNGKSMNYHQWYTKKVLIESEIASLKAEVESEKEDNPYLLSGDELKRTEDKHKTH